MDAQGFFIIVTVVVGSLMVIVGSIRTRPLREGSADPWLRVLFLGLAGLIGWAFLRDVDGYEFAVLAACLLSGAAASQVTLDRGQAAAGSSVIATGTVAVSLYALSMFGLMDFGDDTSWLAEVAVAVIGSMFLAFIPAGIAGWLAADFRNWWIRRSKTSLRQRAA